MRIFLTGYMGCGKTTYGKSLAEHLGIAFIDLDEMIELRTGNSVNWVFEHRGEAWFREQEKLTLEDCLTKDDFVMATGGGTPCFFDNMQKMNDAGMVIYIRMIAGKLYHRLVQERDHRPRIRELSEIDLMELIVEDITRREHIYMKAKHVIDGDLVSLEGLVKLLGENSESKKVPLS